MTLCDSAIFSPGHSVPEVHDLEQEKSVIFILIIL